ncbi:MAG: hypothetical protein IJZ54_07645 [Clostridia bacterium]|nr:hypothetical protein [Clostridia bacterium]
MNFDYIFDSSSRTCEAEVAFDYENLISVKLLFLKENITLTADATGNAIFTDSEGKEILKDKAQGENKYFSKVFVSVKDSKICVRFPVTETIDHYPNCDGEYDRYSERIVDNIFIYCPV